MNHSVKLLLGIVAIPLLFSCNRNQIQAENSLEGNWTVVAITSYYGDFDGTSFNVEETIEESGNLGSFIFAENRLVFNFTRNDTFFGGTAPWTLSADKVREGFFRVPEFVLDIEDSFSFDVQFEDETKNAERDAENVRFTSPEADSRELIIEMSLEKN